MIDKGLEKLTKGGAGGKAKLKDNDGTGGHSTTSDLYVEDAWAGSTLGGLLEEYFITRGDVR